MATKKSSPQTGEVVTLTVRLDKAQYKRLRQLAFDKETSMHSLIVEGIEKILKADEY